MTDLGTNCLLTAGQVIVERAALNDTAAWLFAAIVILVVIAALEIEEPPRRRR